MIQVLFDHESTHRSKSSYISWARGVGLDLSRPFETRAEKAFFNPRYRNSTVGIRQDKGDWRYVDVKMFKPLLLDRPLEEYL